MESRYSYRSDKLYAALNGYWLRLLPDQSLPARRLFRTLSPLVYGGRIRKLRSFF